MSTLASENIITGYGNHEVVHGISLTAELGKITCIFGPNGCGKSTVLKAIAGALPVWSGAARLGDTVLSNLPVHQVVRQGLVPQGGGVFPRLIVMNDLRMGGYAITDTRLVERRIDMLIGQYPSLARRRKTAAGALSGGEQAMLSRRPRCRVCLLSAWPRRCSARPSYANALLRQRRDLLQRLDHHGRRDRAGGRLVEQDKARLGNQRGG
ncbi:ATP-binding cassette domain-containing protein [Mesorhizobium sp. CA4]|uniref:ATP-binding cassette domain-containing protein n=1 Tax=Mesorhizobium sp. CA4 TaxID=588499 RepID=UPI001CD153D3|nr:ATP-binding cassette domain-containing protein [Mesorhizobium sp. CA4]MBZ9823064.1 ATP-binding cassette domain-containing protein [Mesorhizobium sp. CA4]